MQLLSIGVINLNLDGTPQRVGGNPVESYGPADVAGLSHMWLCGYGVQQQCRLPTRWRSNSRSSPA
jgi:hypothetical protein